MIPQIVAEHWVIISLTGLVIGLDKGGIKPLSILAIYIVTSVLDPKMMLAVFAPLMFIGEIFPSIHYREDRNTPVVLRFLPWVMTGLIIGALVGTRLSDKVFGITISTIILFMSLILTKIEFRPTTVKPHHATGIRIGLGLIAGFGSIIGNAAGGVTNTYFLFHIREKRSFIGSSAFLYLFINGTKLLIYIIFWRIISAESLLITSWMLPGILIGILIATRLVKIIPERVYRLVVLLSVYYSGIAMLLRYV